MSNPTSELPDLRVAPLAALRLHETCDEARVQRLTARLQSEGVLRNPPIVAPLGDGQSYVVLDGATRTTALQRLGVRDVLVQVVNYDDPAVELHTWHHLVTGLSRETCARAIRDAVGLSCAHTSTAEAQAAVERGEALAAIVWRDGVACAIGREETATLALQDRAGLLVRLVDAYLASGAKVFRVGADCFDDAVAQAEDSAALIFFPRLRPADILTLAANSARLPAGVTRHVIPNRALRVNLSLDFLRRDKPLTEKNAWLAEMIRQRMASKGIRYYAEPTFVFDE